MTDNHPVEGRLKDALEAQAETFPASPDAWQQIQAKQTALGRRQRRRPGRLAQARSAQARPARRGGFMLPAAAAATVIAVALGATALTHGFSGTAGRAAGRTAGHRAGRTAAGKPAAPSAAQRRAVADAAANLKAFVVPPGARRLSQAPDALKGDPVHLESSSLVGDVSFWRAPGQPQAVLAWEKMHLPRRFTLAASGQAGGPGLPDGGHWDLFGLTAIPGVLTDRALVVTVTAAGNGQTAIRVDAQDTWQPARPASERVPSAARLVTITELPGLDGGHPPAPVTITSPAIVQQLAELVDSLQPDTNTPISCPPPLGNAIRLTFLATPGGSPLAVAQFPAVCGGLAFSIGGKQQPALDLTDSFIPAVLKLAGLNWKIP